MSDCLTCCVCKKPAELRYHTEQDSDGPGNITYVHVACTSCGIRSREGIAFKEFKEKLRSEWGQP